LLPGLDRYRDVELNEAALAPKLISSNKIRVLNTISAVVNDKFIEVVGG
jgi:hypothetical protein